MSDDDWAKTDVATGTWTLEQAEKVLRGFTDKSHRLEVEPCLMGPKAFALFKAGEWPCVCGRYYKDHP